MTISEVYRNLVAAVNEWQHVLFNYNYFRGDSEISWRCAERVRTPDRMMADDVRRLAGGHNYSFQVQPDDGLVQLAYTFSGTGVLTGATLGYYSTKITGLSEDPDDDAIALLLDARAGRGDDGRELTEADPLAEDFRGLELTDTTPNDPAASEEAIWLRIDYDPTAQGRGVLHHNCHLHVGGLEGARIPVGGVPSPRQFLEFVIALFYPSQYRDHRLNGTCGVPTSSSVSSVNALSFPVEPKDVIRALMHLGVPGC